MENKEFNLGKYLSGGVERIAKGAIRATLTRKPLADVCCMSGEKAWRRFWQKAQGI